MHLTYKGKTIWMTPDFSPENVDSRQKWHDIFQMLKENPVNPNAYILLNIYFRNRGNQDILRWSKTILRICAPADVPFPKRRAKRSSPKRRTWQKNKGRKHGDHRAELCVEGSALPCCSAGLPLFHPGFQVEPDSLGVSPAPTTEQLCHSGQVPQI